MGDENSLIKSGSFVFVSQIAMYLSGFIVIPFLTRLLGTDGFGRFSIFLAVFGILRLVAGVGVFDSTRKHIAGEQTQNRQTVHLSSGVIIVSISTVLLIISVPLIRLAITETRISLSTNVIPLLILGVISANLYDVLRAGFHGLQQEEFQAKSELARNGLYILLATAGATAYGLVGGLTGYVLSFTAAASLSLYYIYRLFDWSGVSFWQSVSNMPKIMKYGAIQALGGISAALLYKVDVLMVDSFLSPTSTAYYKSALLSAELLWIIPSTLQIVLLSSVSNLWSNNEVAEINRMMAKVVRYALLLTVLCTVGLFGLSEQFLSVYFGNSYESAAVALQVLLAGAFLFSLARLIVPVLQATGSVVYTEAATFVTLLINILINYFLIPELKIVGAAIGTSISYGLLFIFVAFIWNKREFNIIHNIRLQKILIGGVIFALIYIPLTRLFARKSIFGIIVFALIGICIYIPVNVTTGAIEIREIEEVINTGLSVLNRSTET